MTTQDFLATYDAKVAEYLLALCYLLLFVPMWRFVHGHPRAAEATAGATARVAAPAEAVAAARGWFHAPEGVALHAGHAWAREEADGLVTVGIDEFAQRLVDPERVELPAVGDRVLEGRPAFAVGDRVVTVPMVSPVEGEVVAVNAAAGDGTDARRDPYGAGWLFKVRPAGPIARARLMAGEAAQSFLERTAEALSLRLDPALGHVLQDGGTPVHGIARALAGDGWATMARHFFRTEG